MPIASAFLVLAALVVLAGCVGVALRIRASKARRAGGVEVDDALVAPTDRGDVATLVQFSTQMCAQCPGMRRQLTALASEREGVRHVDIDLTDQPELATRLRILQTPTIFVLDASGEVRSRFGGATPRSAVAAELDRIQELTRV